MTVLSFHIPCLSLFFFLLWRKEGRPRLCGFCYFHFISLESLCSSRLLNTSKTQVHNIKWWNKADMSSSFSTTFI